MLRFGTLWCRYPVHLLACVHLTCSYLSLSMAYTAGDFDAGDIWFFPGNFPHVIVGVDPQLGCTYLTAYDQGDFEERTDAKGLSNWFSQAPANIAAQVS